MSDPKKHHFVPEVYLQRFAINKQGDLFKLIVKSDYKNVKPKLVNKSQVCYEDNMYRFTNNEFIIANELDDPNYIEKNKYTYESNELNVLFNKIDTGAKLFKTEFDRILQILINLKKRNPALRDIYLKRDNDEEFIQSRIRGIKRDLEREGVQIDDIEKILERAKTQVLNQLKEDKYRLDMYRNNLLMVDEEIIQNENDILEKLKKWRPVILHTNFEIPFITSDNPGYTVRNGVEIFNTNFSNVEKFVFPISPKSILVLVKDTIRKDQLIFKTIGRKKATKEEVLLYNAGTFHNSINYILGSSKDQLSLSALYN